MSIEMIDSVLRKMDSDLELHHRTWEIDGDLYRCRHCNAGQLASKCGEKFVHASDCGVQGTASGHPWLDLVRLTSVMATPPAQVQTRYCDTCEREVPDPCSSWDCSTPEKDKWEQPVNQNSGSPEWSEVLLQLDVVREAHTSRDSAERLKNMDAGTALREAIDKLKALRASQHQGAPANLMFPTMLRRMWSGGEVQQWINDLGPLYRKPPVSHGDTAALRQVYDLIGLSYSQPVSVLLVNFKNIIRFANLLHAIEREFLMVPGEPSGEPEDEGSEPDDVCMVNCWGATHEQYIEQFRAALAMLTDKRTADTTNTSGHAH
ncbi:hypothetical protein ACTXN4_10045 [Pseudomonas helleri]|nr:hypothetical protein [Pseudomonas helleri]MQT73256.1 hypothetical protein [Pseudomonas helleri]MQT96792.1 hypothetical protein [Pseudomonas helleri]MQU31991.1 hypothetical protein [Pseudomonas helleri]